MYYFLLFFLVMFLVVLGGGSNICKNVVSLKRIYIVVFFLLLFLMGMRHYSVGTDTITYVGEFIRTSTNGNLWQILTSATEPLYNLTLWVCKKLTSNYTWFLSAFSFPVAWGFTSLIKKYSDDYLISVLLFMVLGILGFCMAGIRQAAALGITMLSYNFVKEKKLFKFLLCVFVAYGFHNSALVYLLAYVFVNILNIKKITSYWVMTAICFFLGVVRNPIVLKLAQIMMIEDRFDGYAQGVNSNLNYTMFIIQAILLLFSCFYMKRKQTLKNEDNSKLLTISFVGLYFQAFTPIVGEFFRVSMYFSVYQCLLVPNIIKEIENRRTKYIIYFGILAAGFMYIFLVQGTAASYIPFWK